LVVARGIVVRALAVAVPVGDGEGCDEHATRRPVAPRPRTRAWRGRRDERDERRRFIG
jgi:hypothetical protein